MADEPLDRIILISSGIVDAMKKGKKIASFSTFPGARLEGYGDSGAWIGEINYMDLKKPRGALATFVTRTPTRFVLWRNQDLQTLLKEVRWGLVTSHNRWIKKSSFPLSGLDRIASCQRPSLKR